MKNIKMKFLLGNALMLALVCAVYAGIPGQINYQGKLTDNTGQPLTGSYDFMFTLYDDYSAGNSTWTETQTSVSVANGLYGVQLGKVNNGLASLTFNATYYLEIQVRATGGSTFEKLTPRQQLSSTPYAFRSTYADFAGTVGGVSPASVSGGTFPNNVIISSIQSGAYNNIIVSSFQTGAYENVRVGTATYALNAVALNGNPASAFVVLGATQTFSGYNTFNQVSVTSLTFTGANVVLNATATYAANAANASALNGNGSSAFSLLTATQSFSGYDTFNQVQVTSITITGANVIITATATYAQAAGSAGTASSIANGVYTNANNIMIGTNTFSGYNSFGQVQVTSLTFIGANVVINATATYATNAGNAGALNGSPASTFVILSSTQSFTGYDTFNQVQVTSITITGANVVLTATAAYATNAAALNGSPASTFVILSSTQSFTGYDTFNQVQVTSITITGANVVLTATAAYATNAAALNGSPASTFVILSSTQSFTGYDTFNQVSVTSITITGANVVLKATATYASMAGIAGTIVSGTLPNTVIVSSIQSGAYGNIIVSSFQTGAYENVRVGTATVANSLAAGSFSAGAVGAGTLIDTVKITTGSIVGGTLPNTVIVSSIQGGAYSNIIISSFQTGAYENVRVGTATVANSLAAGSFSAGAVGAGTLIDTVKITTGSIVGGTLPNTVIVSSIQGGAYSNIIISSFQTGAYENVRVGTATVANSLAAGSFSASAVGAGTLIDTVKITTGSIVSGTLPNTVIVSSIQSGAYGNIIVSTFQTGAYENVRVGTATVANSLAAGSFSAGAVGAGTLIDTVKITTGSIVGGTLPNTVIISSIQSGAYSNIIVSSFQTGAYENVRVGTATVANSLAAGSFSAGAVGAGTLIDTVKITTGSIVSGTLPNTVIVSSIQSGAYGNIIVSSFQTGAYENMHVGTATVANSIASGATGTLPDAVKITTGSIVAGTLPDTVIVSSIQSGAYGNIIVSSFQTGAYESISVGTATIANSLSSSWVGAVEYVHVGTATVANSISSGATGTLPDAVKITTGSIVGGTLPSNVIISSIQSGAYGNIIVSSFQTGAYENVSVGTATVANSLSTGLIASYENIRVGTASVALSVSTTSVLVVSSITANGFVGLENVTTLQLQGLQPSAEGQLYYDIDDKKVYVSTGTLTQGAFAQVNNPALGP